MTRKTAVGTVEKATAIAATLLLFVLAASEAFSQQLADVLRPSRQGLQFNARALGMGNAYSTVGYDFSALCFNPATMAASRHTSYTMTLNSNSFNSSSDYHGTNVDFATSNSTLSQMGITIPFAFDSTHQSVLGLGFTQSKDFNLGFKYEGLNAGSPSFIQNLAAAGDPAARALALSYADYDASGRYLGDQTILGSRLYEEGYLLDEGALFHLSIGAATEAAHNVFFGVSANYNTGAYVSDLELAAVDTNDAYPAGVLTVPGDAGSNGFLGATYRAVRDQDYSGWDFRFGIMYKLENLIGWSASFKLPAARKIRETLFLSGASNFASGRDLKVPQTESTSYHSFMLPSEATFGVMMNLWFLTATAEARYVDYSDIKITSGAGGLPDRTRKHKLIKDELGAVLNLNAGVEFRPPYTSLSVRAGGIYQPSPYKGDPSRYAQKFLTAGFGINSNQKIQFDVGYAYGWRGENKNFQTGGEGGAEQAIAHHNILFTLKFAP